MSIARDSIHKRRPSGGKRKAYRMKRKFELGRQAAATKLGPKTIRLVRCRYGIIKRRALRLETGNFAWPAQGMAARARILNVVYNASNNELVRTNTLVRNAIVQVDAAPFRQWFVKYYGIEIADKKADARKERAAKAEKEKKDKAEKKKEAEKKPEEAEKPKEEKKAEEEPKKKEKKPKKEEEKKGPSAAVIAKHRRRQKLYKMDPQLEVEFGTGKLLACITSRPGQVGRADGYILEGKELEFYQKKIEKKKKTK
jgi:small subunit ribosomal protein S8e